MGARITLYFSRLFFIGRSFLSPLPPVDGLPCRRRELWILSSFAWEIPVKRGSDPMMVQRLTARTFFFFSFFGGLLCGSTVPFLVLILFLSPFSSVLSFLSHLDFGVYYYVTLSLDFLPPPFLLFFRLFCLLFISSSSSHIIMTRKEKKKTP